MSPILEFHKLYNRWVLIPRWRRKEQAAFDESERLRKLRNNPTPPEYLKSFIRKLHPRATEHELIRIGNVRDGGYLIPDDLIGIQTCFSPGVSDLSDFESDLAKLGIASFMADYSVERPGVDSPLFHFEKKFLGKNNDDVFTTLESWMDRNAPDQSDMILQMDIEGAEYDVLEATSANHLNQFRIMVIEFHNLEMMRELDLFERLRTIFQKLSVNFTIVHNHPNNCSRMINYRDIEIPSVSEFTFLNKSRIKKTKPTRSFPHPLDNYNTNDKKPLDLPSAWYGA